MFSYPVNHLTTGLSCFRRWLKEASIPHNSPKHTDIALCLVSCAEGLNVSLWLSFLSFLTQIFLSRDLLSATRRLDFHFFGSYKQPTDEVNMNCLMIN